MTFGRYWGHSLYFQNYRERGMGHEAWGMAYGAWGMGHGAWGMGHGAWGMGHGAWGMGHGAWGIYVKYYVNLTFYSVGKYICYTSVPLHIRIFVHACMYIQNVPYSLQLISWFRN